VLQEAGLARLDGTSRAKARVIVQSAPALRAAHAPGDVELVAVGHLRDEKDPATLMRAARLLASDRASPTIAHIGAALDPRLGELARTTMAQCPAYRWLGALPHGAARRAIAAARALVHMSRMEGGANVVIEAVRSGVPVLASRIDGNVGLLGPDYDGYFAVGDADALAALVRRFRAEAAFVAHLRAQCAAREPLFRPAAERRAVRTLVADLLAARSPAR
jgi:glycosyltransferase involved in cell wall biosynthesis